MLRVITMSGGSHLVFLLFVCSVAGGRDARWFNREVHTLTSTVKLRRMVTEATPSSCVVVQTSLPPCRHIREAPIQPTQTQQIISMQTAPPRDQGWKPLLQPSDPLPPHGAVSKSSTPPIPTASSATGWSWDIFNFGARQVVVTKTVTELYTTKYLDPKTVVTFSVKGCRPSRLPFDLPECQVARAPPPPPEVPERGVIVMAPIQLVPAIEGTELMKSSITPAPQSNKEMEDKPKEVKEEEKDVKETV